MHDAKCKCESNRLKNCLTHAAEGEGARLYNTSRSLAKSQVLNVKYTVKDDTQ